MLDDMVEDGETGEIERMLRDSAAAVTGGGALRRARDLRFTPAGFDRAVLAQMADLGWLGLRLPETAGGMGLGMAAMCTLACELGGALVPEPLIETALSLRLLADAAPDSDLLPAVLGAEKAAITAWSAATDGLDLPQAGTVRDFVPLAGGADVILVPVREGDGYALYSCDPASLEIEILRQQDGSHSARIAGDGGWPGERLGPLDAGVFAAALDEAALATAAYLTGLAATPFAMTLDYLRTRRQFGRAIGSFQALQHRAVDQKIALELARASLFAAARQLDAGVDAASRALAVSRAKARAGETAMSVCREALQMHGAIGYTDEHDIGLFLRKALVLVNAFGSPAWHRRRYASLQIGKRD